MKKIKNRTYHNFLLVMKHIEEKGYTTAEAEEITRRIFDDYEINPEGLSINARVERIITKSEWEKIER